MSDSMRSKTIGMVKEWLANTAFFGTIALVILLLSIPTVVFLVFRDSDLSNWQYSLSPLSSFLDTCVTQSVRNTSNTSTSLGCTALPETSPCYSHIGDLLEQPAASDNTSVIVFPRGDMTELHNNLDLLLRDSLGLLTAECRSGGLPLYCNFLFPPCYNGSVDPTLQLSHSQCRTLVEDVCVEEVGLLMLYLDYIRERAANLIPNCNTLQEGNSETLTSEEGSGANSTNSVANGTSDTSTTVTGMPCHPDFVSVCGLCVPSCGGFNLNSPLATGYTMDDVFLVTGTVMATMAALTYIVLSLIRRKDMFQFPIILVFYENLAELLLCVVLLLGPIIGKEKAFCSHPDVVRTVNSPPTFFCSLSGFVFQFMVGVLVGCWLAQLAYMVILLHFPFFGERTLKKKKKLYHVVSLVVIITFSLITPVVSLARFNYVTVRFPPFICLPSNQDWVFYSFGLPLSICAVIGAIFCILLTRAVHKGLRTQANQLKDKLTSKKRQFFSTPEVKLLILSVMIIVIGVVTLGRFSYLLATQSQYVRQTVQYSVCQLRGRNPECIVETVISNVNIATNILGIVAFTAIPVLNMIFPIRYGDFVKLANLLCCICRRKWNCVSTGVERTPPQNGRIPA